MRRTAILAAVLVFVAAPAFAQDALPRAFAGWDANGRSSFNPTKDAADKNPAPAQVVVEYGFFSGEQCGYVHNSETLNIQLYRMKDPSGAYGLYSYLRTPDLPHADLAEHSAMSRDHALVLVGNLVLDVRGSDVSKSSADLKALVAAVAPHSDQGLLPTLPQRLPANGMVERSDHYILGPAALVQFLPIGSDDWLGFSQGAEAEVAKYRLGGHDESLLIVDFPTPQTAQKKLAEWQKRFNVNGSNSSAGSPVLFVKRSLTLIAMVSGAGNQAEADKLLRQVQSGTEVTWNEPPFEVTEPGIGVMIVGAIFGTGVICAFALVSGVAFGGVRLVVKRFLPDRVFDRSNHLQVLQLGLSSKPINAEDFYGVGGGRHK
jgi:hypothetical protein